MTEMCLPCHYGRIGPLQMSEGVSGLDWYSFYRGAFPPVFFLAVVEIGIAAARAFVSVRVVWKFLTS